MWRFYLKTKMGCWCPYTVGEMCTMYTSVFDVWLWNFDFDKLCKANRIKHWLHTSDFCAVHFSKAKELSVKSVCTTFLECTTKIYVWKIPFTALPSFLEKSGLFRSSQAEVTKRDQCVIAYKESARKSLEKVASAGEFHSFLTTTAVLQN